MLALGFLIALLGIGFLCWLMFALAALALPLFVGVIAALAAYHHDAGLVGAGLIALLAAALTLAAGQVAFALVRAPLARLAIALVFAVPAALAGYSASFGLLHLFTAAPLWCQAFGLIGGVAVGLSAALRLTAPAMAGPVPHHTVSAAG